MIKPVDRVTSLGYNPNLAFLGIEVLEDLWSIKTLQYNLQLLIAL